MNAKLNLRSFALLLFIIGAKCAFAQEISNPSIVDEDNTPLGIVCPNSDDGANEFRFRFTVSGNFSTPDNNNNFILELSDKTGDFDNAIVLSDAPSGGFENTDFGSNQFPISFNNVSFPNDIGSDTYRIRVRSTNPEVISEASEAFVAHYFDRNRQIQILNNNGVVTGDQSICSSDGFLTLTATPDDYPAYKWYKDDVLISGQTSANLLVEEEGAYYASIDLGLCNESYPGSVSGADTNIVNVSRLDQDNFLFLVDAFNDEITTDVSVCEEQGYTIRTNVSNPEYEYNWFKDDLPIATPPQPWQLELSEPGFGGDYRVEVTAGNCIANSQVVTITTKNAQIAIDKPGAVPVFGIDGKVTLNAITDVPNPELQWFKGGLAVLGATATSYVVNSIDVDDYYVQLTSTTECGTTTNSQTVTVFTPTDFEVSIDFQDPSLEGCDIETRTLIIDQIIAKGNKPDMSLIDEILDPQVYDLLPLNWQLSGTDIDNATDITYTVQDTQQAGNYTLRVENVISNELDVTLQVSNTLSASASFLCFGDNVLITAFSDSFSYIWFNENGPIEGETGNTLLVETPGSYSAQVTVPGCGTSFTEELSIELFSDSVISVSPGTIVDFGESTEQTLTASGAESYTWLKLTEEADGTITRDIVSTEETLTVNEEVFEEGQVINYLLLSKVGDCDVPTDIIIKRELSDIIPNLITANGDSINDRWVIPSDYLTSDVEITIYDLKGEIDLQTNSYQNNWPDVDSKSAGKNAVYYYFIENRSNGQIEKGTITVMR